MKNLRVLLIPESISQETLDCPVVKELIAKNHCEVLLFGKYIQGPLGVVQSLLTQIAGSNGYDSHMQPENLPKTVYIAHPFTSFGTLEENRIRNLEIAKKYADAKRVAPISPIIAFGELFEGNGEHIMGCCKALLKSCDMAHFFGDWEKSEGCRQEMDFCLANDIPVLHDEEIIKEMYWNE